MSYFMTISGSPPSSSGLEPIEFIPIDDAQEYSDLEEVLSTLDGTPLFLVHDGASGTSHSFIADAQNKMQMNHTLKGTVFLMLIEACVSTVNTFRIWWDQNGPNDYNEVVECSSLSQVIAVIEDQIRGGEGIAIRYKKVPG